MLELYTRILTRMQREDGQTMAEYAVVLGVITILVVVALGALSSSISGELSAVTNIL